MADLLIIAAIVYFIGAAFFYCIMAGDAVDPLDHVFCFVLAAIWLPMALFLIGLRLIDGGGTGD